MTSRFRLALAVAGTLALAGCGDAFHVGPPQYTNSPNLADLKAENGAPKAQLQGRIRELLGEVFGPTPSQLKVPPGAGLRDGGAHLAAFAVLGNDKDAQPKPVIYKTAEADGTMRPHRSPGGYALYRQHCLHCHGASGDGAGPTAAFLWPPPRDYRRGIFKFTSTPNGAKPARDDLRRILLNGIPNTSMPAFDALMTKNDIEQVIDYVIFLTARGETERALIDSAIDQEEPAATLSADEQKKALAEALPAEGALASAQRAFASWAEAEAQVVNPPQPRPAPAQESIERGKALFLGAKNLQCAGCHGAQAIGDGPSFVDMKSYNAAVFTTDPEQPNRFVGLKDFAERNQKKWADDWGNPIRPANLNLGVYKGGRRPLDIYWRLAKGINGTPMPAHAGTISEPEIWDLVNFVLALPYQPDLLKDATIAPAATGTPATTTASATPPAPARP